MFQYRICVIIISFLISYTNIKSQPYCEGEYITLNALDYSTGDIQWQYSFDNTVWYDIDGANELSYTFYPQQNTYLRLKITDPECLPAYFTEVQFIELIPEPTEPIAGEDQFDIDGTSTFLEANLPIHGTGLWSIIQGEGGSIQDLNNPNSEFSGNAGEEYILSWAIFNDCGYSNDYVTIHFAEEEPFACGDNLIDPRDNQEYATVQIGSQCWMAENLNVGVMINGADNQTDNDIIEKYCYANDTENCNTYGGLYQWDEMMQYSTQESTQGICPPGWHIPSDDEFKILEMELGMTQQEADMENGWRGTGVGTALNIGGSSGFDAVFGGRRQGVNSFALLGSAGYIYTSTEADNPNNAWRRCFSPTDSRVGRYDSFSKAHGYSVRCLKSD